MFNFLANIYIAVLEVNADVWGTQNAIQKHVKPPGNHFIATTQPGTVLNWHNSFFYIFRFATH